MVVSSKILMSKRIPWQYPVCFITWDFSSNSPNDCFSEITMFEDISETEYAGISP